MDNLDASDFYDFYETMSISLYNVANVVSGGGGGGGGVIVVALLIICLNMSPWWSLCTLYLSHARWSFCFFSLWGDQGAVL